MTLLLSNPHSFALIAYFYCVLQPCISKEKDYHNRKFARSVATAVTSANSNLERCTYFLSKWLSAVILTQLSILVHCTIVRGVHVLLITSSTADRDFDTAGIVSYGFEISVFDNYLLGIATLYLPPQLRGSAGWLVSASFLPWSLRLVRYGRLCA